MLVPASQTTQSSQLHTLSVSEWCCGRWSSTKVMCKNCHLLPLCGFIEEDGSVNIPPLQPLNCQWLRNSQSCFGKEGQKAVPFDCWILVKNWLCILIMQIFQWGFGKYLGSDTYARRWMSPVLSYLSSCQWCLSNLRISSYVFSLTMIVASQSLDLG